MNTKNALTSVKRLFVAMVFLLFATIGAFAQNLYYFHDY